MADGGRVIAGSAAGRRLVAPGGGTRPLSDRVKQALFAILEPALPGALVLDLFAGSGAAGIEALSRGAARATFVDRDAGAIRAIRENLARTGLAGHADVHARDALAYLAGAGSGVVPGPWQVVVVDPPYADRELLRTVLEILGEAGRLMPGGRVAAKHFWRDVLPEEIGLLRSDRSRRFGETALTFYRAAGPRADAALLAEAESPGRGGEES